MCPRYVGFRVQGLGLEFRVSVQGLEFGHLGECVQDMQALGFRVQVQGLGLRIQDTLANVSKICRLQALGFRFRVQDSGHLGECVQKWPLVHAAPLRPEFFSRPFFFKKRKHGIFQTPLGMAYRERGGGGRERGVGEMDRKRERERESFIRNFLYWMRPECK